MGENMNIFKEVNQYRDEILNNCVLIEYDLFYNNIFESHCRFAIDEREELEKLNNVILKIKQRDEKADIYVCTYGIELANDWKYIYADTLWIDTIIDVAELYSLFKYSREVEPGNIVLLSEDEMINGEIVLVFSSDRTVQDYKSFLGKRQLINIKCLFWD